MFHLKKRADETVSPAVLHVGFPQHLLLLPLLHNCALFLRLYHVHFDGVSDEIDARIYFCA